MKRSRIYLAAFIFSFIVRIALCIFVAYKMPGAASGGGSKTGMGGQSITFGDEMQYEAMAINLLAGRGYSSEPIENSNFQTVPLYPTFLASVYAIFGVGNQWPVKILQSAASAFTVVVAGWIAERLGGSRTSAITMAIASIYPYMFLWTPFMLTETLGVLLTLMALWLSIEYNLKPSMKTLISLAIVFGLTSQIRFVIGYAFIWLVLAIWVNHGLKKAVASSIIIISITATISAPWAIRNYRLSEGKMILFSYNAGQALYNGNNPMNESGGGIRGVDYLEPPEIANLPELEKDDRLKALAVEWMKENPLKVFQLSFKRIWRLWRPTPHHKNFRAFKYQLMGWSTYGVLFPFFISGLWIARKKWALMLFPIGLIIMLTAMHAVTYGSLRYRAPIEPLIVIFASLAIDRIIKNTRDCNS